MSGIGHTLRNERQRQGRTLADAAAETRVRESYLQAIEEEDFDVLGGDVYSRGFIRLYGKYLGLDAEELVHLFKEHHERPQAISVIPGATLEEMMSPMGGLPRLAMSVPVLLGVGIVVVLTALFLFARNGSEEDTALDPNAPGPSPAAAAADAAPTDAVGITPVTVPTATPVEGEGAAPVGEVMQEVEVVVTAVRAIQLTVVRGQPPVTGATLEPGDSRTLIDPAGEQVTFTVSDFTAAAITVNGDLLPSDSPELAGRAVEISCTVGEAGCRATAL